MTARHWKDGKPFYCVKCWRFGADYLICKSKENCLCELESKDDAQRRTGDTHCNVCEIEAVDPEEGETTCHKCLTTGRTINDYRHARI